MEIPENHQEVTPYCMVRNAFEFVDFTKDAFDAELVTTTKLDEDSETVIHGEIQIGNSTVMFADGTPESTGSGDGSQSSEDNEPSSVQLLLYVEDADESYKRALDYGAIAAMDVTDQGDNRMGGVVDPFDNLWWIKSMK